MPASRTRSQSDSGTRTRHSAPQICAAWAGMGSTLRVHPTMLPRALRDRGVSRQFDLLHVGASQAGFHALRAALVDFAPRIILASFLPELGDEDLVAPLSDFDAPFRPSIRRRHGSRSTGLPQRSATTSTLAPDQSTMSCCLRHDVQQTFPEPPQAPAGEASPTAPRKAGFLTSEHYLLDGVAVASTRYGQIAYFKNDAYVGQAFANGGYWDENTLTTIAKLLQGRSDFVLDVGAHIGSHSVFLARANSNLRFCCFEPQRPLFLLLERNIYENHLAARIEAVWSAVGHKKRQLRDVVHRRRERNSPGSPARYGRKGELRWRCSLVRPARPAP